MDDLVAIARVVRPRGLKGECVAEVLTDFPQRFEQLENVVAVLPGGERRELKIEDAWFQKGRIVLKFSGLETADSAEELRNAEICVAEADAVELDKDEYFDWQLEGCKVIMPDGGKLGTVTAVMRTGGTELLQVSSGERDHLIPFARSICVEVDKEGKVIRIDPPEGLLDF
jgi:16S rRNA processing protein RimM